MELIHVESLSELDSAAEQIIANLSPNRIMCFYGSMGAGKTTLIKSICKVLGVTDTVVSPTFALINEYTTAKGIPVYHFDFYRINKVEEVYDFGYEEYFYSDTGVCLIEWPELIEDLLPTEGVVRYKIDVNPDNSRTITEID
ncbi:MAG: tRNA (adenosine(37)-N6)-threonylcarbamoyltransferase complex ATPase subunit type 1 TsaE [Bacteroidales bacterium]|nr:tRNA (adenosine(37)-N6)-threonylcarbamoyltransferase complex ATPase subunit type 1 TsaE [Bacteroidales bacterium]MDY0198544.1 tRNA (adenosine(37)-N6)-threonylcarbamoyltransferase complex ATPase subunit type 1 TsaE [Tenuifilaceae bacterium]